MRVHNLSLNKKIVSSPNERSKSKVLLPLTKHRRLKSLNEALAHCLPISSKFRRLLAEKIGVPPRLVKRISINTKAANHG